MAYKVIEYFVDLLDDNHEYFPGDDFPRDGNKVSEKRKKELIGNKNARGKALIINEKNILKRR